MLQIRTKPVMINNAFLDEIKTLHHELWEALSELKELCATELSHPRQYFELAARLHDFREKLLLQFSLEDAYGYFFDARFHPCDVSVKASRLMHQHGELRQNVTEIAEVATKRLHERKLMELKTLTTAEFLAFARELDAHERAESALMMAEIMQDDGGGG